MRLVPSPHLGQLEHPSSATDQGVVPINTGEDRGDADGVMLISAWTDGAGGGFLARVTLSGTGPDPEVRVLASTDEVLAAVRQWLEELGKAV